MKEALRQQTGDGSPARAGVDARTVHERVPVRRSQELSLGRLPEGVRKRWRDGRAKFHDEDDHVTTCATPDCSGKSGGRATGTPLET